jgi:hypothetical protein
LKLPQNPDVRTNNSGQRSGVPFKSKLAPFEPQIRQWLCDNKSYSEMAELLGSEHGLKVDPSTINAFVLVRSRRRSRAMLPADPETPEAIPTPPSAPAGPQNGQEAVCSPKGKPDATGNGHMLPPQHSKHLDSHGQPVEAPPNPDDFRIENL